VCQASATVGAQAVWNSSCSPVDTPFVVSADRRTFGRSDGRGAGVEVVEGRRAVLHLETSTFRGNKHPCRETSFPFLESVRLWWESATRPGAAGSGRCTTPNRD